jgi:hypothetical protein
MLLGLPLEVGLNVWNNIIQEAKYIFLLYRPNYYIRTCLLTQYMFLPLSFYYNSFFTLQGSNSSYFTLSAVVDKHCLARGESKT